MRKAERKLKSCVCAKSTVFKVSFEDWCGQSENRCDASRHSRCESGVPLQPCLVPSHLDCTLHHCTTGPTASVLRSVSSTRFTPSSRRKPKCCSACVVFLHVVLLTPFVFHPPPLIDLRSRLSSAQAVHRIVSSPSSPSTMTMIIVTSSRKEDGSPCRGRSALSAECAFIERGKL